MLFDQTTAGDYRQEIPNNCVTEKREAFTRILDNQLHGTDMTMAQQFRQSASSSSSERNLITIETSKFGMSKCETSEFKPPLIQKSPSKLQQSHTSKFQEVRFEQDQPKQPIPVKRKRLPSKKKVELPAGIIDIVEDPVVDSRDTTLDFIKSIQKKKEREELEPDEVDPIFVSMAPKSIKAAYKLPETVNLPQQGRDIPIHLEGFKNN